MSKGRKNKIAQANQLQSSEFEFFKKQQEKQEQIKEPKVIVNDQVKAWFSEALSYASPLVKAFVGLSLGSILIIALMLTISSLVFQSEIVLSGDWSSYHFINQDSPKAQMWEAIQKEDDTKILELWRNNKQVLKYSLDADNKKIKKAILGAVANDKKLKDFQQILVDFKMVDGKGKAILSTGPFADISVINEHIRDSLLYSTLEMAAYNGQTETVKYLIGAFDSVYVPTAILPVAIGKRNMELAKTLFSMGATTEMVRDHAAADLVRENNLPLIKLLIEHGYDVHVDNDYAKRTAMLVGKKEIADYIASVPQIQQTKKNGNDD